MRKYAVLAALLVVILLVLAPFALILINAVKTPQDYAAVGPLALPTHVSFAGIKAFWIRADFGQTLLNSAVISGSVAVLGVGFSLLNAYALGIGRVRGRRWFLAAFLVANLLPQESLIYPLYHIATQVDLYDSQLAVIIIFTAIQSAFGTFLLSSVLAEFPPELLDAAAMDGAGRLRTLVRIVAPVSRPTLAVLFTFFFIWTWNELFIPLVFLVSNSNQTVPLALALLQGEHDLDATATSASALLGILPAVLFFLVFQRTLTRGVTAGAVK
ncbi:carbohydrate ABC transporter permease [Dactylosporangium sp. NPDC049140]|uniref:carbohydrate ABC transporter permease n=1 Tax=unclassified Dactylosporangium TaxID=2621675 RepID=UPI0033FC53AF